MEREIFPNFEDFRDLRRVDRGDFLLIEVCTINSDGRGERSRGDLSSALSRETSGGEVIVGGERVAASEVGCPNAPVLSYLFASKPCRSPRDRDRARRIVRRFGLVDCGF